MPKTVKGLAALMVAVFIIAIVFSQPSPVKAQTKTITVPDDYPTIQAAINAANSGDAIFVRNGYYYEHVIVSKPVTLIGQSNSQTIIDGNYTGNVFYVTASNVTISGFTIQRSSVNGGSGIYLSNTSTGSNLSGNIITSNGNGICVNSSLNNVVSGNTITGNTQGSGVLLSGASFNTISNNTLNNNSDGIEFSSSNGNPDGIYSSNNTVSGNVVDSNNFIGIASWYSSNNLITGNKVSSNSFYGMYICASSNVTISNNTVRGNGDDKGRGGIDIYASFNCAVYQNNILNNPFDGLNVDYGAEGNSIFENNITQNNVGIFIFNYASNNHYYHNNLINNAQQVSSDSSQNIWDDSYPSGGNYWSDYTGADANTDGIGDTAYVINSNNKDNFPLMKTFVAAATPKPTPIPISTPTPLPSPVTMPTTTENGSTVDLTFRGNITAQQILNLTITTKQASKTTTVSFTVTGQNGTTGFSNITIPISLVPYGTAPTIYIDNQPVDSQGYTQDSNNYYLWYTTHFSTHQVSIIFAATATTPTPTTSSSGSQNTVLGLDWVQIAILALMSAIVVAVCIVGFLFLSKNEAQNKQS